LWIFNPRAKPTFRNLPFITRPKQDEAIEAMNNAIGSGHDLLVDKSRDEGATFVILGMFALYFTLVPESIFLVGSRVEELVDKAGNQKCLFWKLKYMLDKLPGCIKPTMIKTHLHLENPANGSAIEGESTNENFGAGSRALAVMLDEFGRVDAKIAQSIRETLSDTTECVIYNSTHFYGKGHPYAKLMRSGKVKVVTLGWEHNPAKNLGLYRSPALNIIEIKDVDFYRKKYIGCFDEIEPMQPVKLSELEKELLTYPKAHDLSFVADGGESNAGGWRSPWYDAECNRRDRRDVAQNIDRNPAGAGDNFFDDRVLERIRTDHIRAPKVAGEVEYELDAKKSPKLYNIKFVPEGGKKRLKWWGDLQAGRPIQHHNYIVGCDISLGMGVSNSTAGIYDVNTREEIGFFACPNTPPESFADQVVAICKWVGGAVKPYLIWEANGPGGSFEKRVRWHGYDFVHSSTDERISYRPRNKKHGWYATRDSKYDMLLELRIALSEGLKTRPEYKSLKIYDEAGLSELSDYIFYENGQIGPSESLDDDAGARSAHGDRVIPKGLYVIALNEQPRAALKERAKVKPGSFAWRRQKFVDSQKKKKQMWHD
jgi:hypothetical protein